MLYRTYALSTRRPSDLHSTYTDAAHPINKHNLTLAAPRQSLEKTRRSLLSLALLSTADVSDSL